MNGMNKAEALRTGSDAPYRFTKITVRNDSKHEIDLPLTVNREGDYHWQKNGPPKYLAPGSTTGPLHGD